MNAKIIKKAFISETDYLNYKEENKKNILKEKKLKDNAIYEVFPVNL